MYFYEIYISVYNASFGATLNIYLKHFSLFFGCDWYNYSFGGILSGWYHSGIIKAQAVIYIPSNMVTVQALFRFVTNRCHLFPSGVFQWNMIATQLMKHPWPLWKDTSNKLINNLINTKRQNNVVCISYELCWKRYIPGITRSIQCLLMLWVFATSSPAYCCLIRICIP